MARLICFIVGFIGIESIAHYLGIDRVANEIQVLSAIPWIYTIYRLEKIHAHHKRAHERKDNHNG